MEGMSSDLWMLQGLLCGLAALCRFKRKSLATAAMAQSKEDEHNYPVVNGGSDNRSGLGVPIFLTNIPYFIRSRLELRIEFPNHLVDDDDDDDDDDDVSPTLW